MAYAIKGSKESERCAKIREDKIMLVVVRCISVMNFTGVYVL